MKKRVFSMSKYLSKDDMLKDVLHYSAALEKAIIEINEWYKLEGCTLSSLLNESDDKESAELVESIIKIDEIKRGLERWSSSTK